jgi:hypothetical protein
MDDDSLAHKDPRMKLDLLRMSIEAQDVALRDGKDVCGKQQGYFNG